VPDVNLRIPSGGRASGIHVTLTSERENLYKTHARQSLPRGLDFYSDLRGDFLPRLVLRTQTRSKRRGGPDVIRVQSTVPSFLPRPVSTLRPLKQTRSINL
jgi:hypothetical protein